MRIAILAAIAFGACVLTDTVHGQQQGPQNVDLLVGQWQGKWSYTTGTMVHEGTFELFVDDKSGHLQGRFVAVALTDTAKNPPNKKLIRKPKTRKLPYRPQTIHDISRTPTEPPIYRFYADGHCWNVTVKENLIAGFRNTGQCSSMGLGSGATMMDVEATRVEPSKR